MMLIFTSNVLIFLETIVRRVIEEGNHDYTVPSVFSFNAYLDYFRLDVGITWHLTIRFDTRYMAHAILR